MPRPTYFLAIETTRRRFASTNRSSALTHAHAALEKHPLGHGRGIGKAGEFFSRAQARLALHCQFDFLLSIQQRNSPDLLEIHPNRVGDLDLVVGGEDVENGVLRVLTELDPLLAKGVEDSVE